MSDNDLPCAQDRTPTLASVATAAGVSTATVARVLKGSGYVGTATRARVLAVLAATGYQPNALARSLRTQRSRTLGILLSRIGRNPLFAEIARSVEAAAMQRGYRVLIVNLEGEPEREREGVRQLIESRVDAMLFIHATDAANVAMAAAAGIATVQVERLVAHESRAVTVDNRAGCLAAMEHLIALGHRRIGYIGVDPCRYPGSMPSIEGERLESYRTALVGAGLTADPNLTRLLPVYPRPGNTDQVAPGHAEMMALLDLAQPPTAVLITGEILATGALQALYARRIRVPDDMSVIGYDDQVVAGYTTPPLSTVVLPNYEMGRKAAELLIDMVVHGKPPPARLLKIDGQLIRRGSVATPPGATVT